MRGLKLVVRVAALACELTAAATLISGLEIGDQANKIQKNIDQMMNSMPEYHQFMEEKLDGINALFEEGKISEDIKESMIGELQGKEGYVMFFKENAQHAKKAEYEQKAKEEEKKDNTSSGLRMSGSVFAGTGGGLILGSVFMSDDENDM